MDNPDRAVDLKAESWAAPVGRLEAMRQVIVDGVQGVYKGSGFLVSPCLVVTAAHLVSPDSDALLYGVIDPHTDFRMIFRATDPVSKASRSIIIKIDNDLNDAKRRFISQRQYLTIKKFNIDENDFIFLRLPQDSCIGSNPNFGWFDTTDSSVTKGIAATALGYPKGQKKGELRLGTGQIGNRAGDNLWNFSGSYKVGESGGPLLVVDQNRLKVAGLIVGHQGSNTSEEYATYSSDNANEILDLVPILNFPPIKAIIDADKARFGRQDPAASRQMVGKLPK